MDMHENCLSEEFHPLKNNYILSHICVHICTDVLHYKCLPNTVYVGTHTADTVARQSVCTLGVWSTP